MFYYIQDTRQYVGNCILWWAHGDRGYTTEIEKAGIYSEEEALDRMRNRGTDKAWPKHGVDAHVVRHVRIEGLRDAVKPLEIPKGEKG